MDTRQGIDRIAEAHRLSLTDAAAVAVEAFEAMSPAEQRAVIERRGDRANEASAA
jgi:hypothetical protein